MTTPKITTKDPKLLQKGKCAECIATGSCIGLLCSDCIFNEQNLQEFMKENGINGIAKIYGEEINCFAAKQK